MELFQSNLKEITAIIQSYYSTDFDSDQEDTEENRKIKKSLSDLLRRAKATLSGTDFLEAKKEILQFFSETIGCAEDIEIFEEESKALIKEEAISEAEIEEVINGSSIQRWK